MATVRYEAVAIVGKRRDGKPNYCRIGTVFETDNGLSLKLDSIPAGGEWNGWVSLFTPKAKEDKPRGSTSAPVSDPDGDVPFRSLRRNELV